MKIFYVIREISTPDGRHLFPRFEGSEEKASERFAEYARGDRDLLEGITCYEDGIYSVDLKLDRFDSAIGTKNLKLKRFEVSVGE